MKLRESNQRTTGISANATLRKACIYAGIPLAAVLLAAFLPAISANAQSSQGGSSQDSSQAASQPAGAPSDSTTPAMQDASAPPAQSLGAAARAANAQKQQTKAKHVYTDDDVSSIGGNISVVGDGHSSGSSDGDANADAQGAGASAGAQDEKYWRDRANQIKNAIADVDRQIEDKKAEIAKAGATSFDPSAGLSQGVIVIHDRNAELKDLEDRKASLENQLDQLADEGRKAGADSGWFR